MGDNPTRDPDSSPTVDPDEDGALPDKDNTARASSTPSGDGRTLWFALGIAVSILAATVVLFLVFLQEKAARREADRAEEAQLTQRLEEMLATLRREGVPVTAAVSAPPSIPDEENGALLLRKSVEFPSPSEDEEFKVGEWYFCDWAEGEGDMDSLKKCLPQAQALLSLYKPKLDLIERALQKSRFRFDMEYEKGHLRDNKSIAELNWIQEIISLRIYTRACQDRGREALEDVERLLLLGRAAGHGRTLVSFLVGLGIQTQAMWDLGKILRVTSPPPDSLRRLGKSFEACGIDWNLKEALIVERAFGIESYKALLRGKGALCEENQAELLSSLPLKRGFVDFLERMKRCLDAVDRPYLEVREMFKNACEAPSWAPWTKILLSFNKSCLEARAAWSARMRISALACFIMAERADGGIQPEDLDTWISNSRKDPFTAKPFITKADGHAILIYSPGVDGIDEGLTPDMFKEGEPDYEWDDIFFYLPSPVRKDQRVGKSGEKK